MIKSIIKFIGNIFTKKKVEIIYVEVKVEVLSANAYERLTKKLESPVLSQSDTAHTASYKLGIQRALSEVRSGFSV